MLCSNYAPLARCSSAKYHFLVMLCWMIWQVAVLGFERTLYAGHQQKSLLLL
jgi:hypothetical protein